MIYSICEDFELNFHAMYACVGLWNTFFLILYALFDVSRLMKWCTRSTEEIFALFISIAFAVDALRDVFKNFKNYYYAPSCTGDLMSPDPFIVLANATFNYTINSTSSLLGNGTLTEPLPDCRRDSSLLFLLLMLGTVWVAVSLYNFNKT